MTLEPLNPRAIQARVRAGDSPEAIAAEMGWPLERVERYAGPPLAERSNIAALAAAVELRRTGEPVTLADSIERVLGHDDDVEWDARRRPEDGRWIVVVSVKSKPVAAWTYDLAGRNVHPLDDEARRLMGVAPVREQAPRESAAHDTAVITRPTHPSHRGSGLQADRGQQPGREHTERHERPHLVSVPSPEPEPEPELAEVVDLEPATHHSGQRHDALADDAADEPADIEHFDVEHLDVEHLDVEPVDDIQPDNAQPGDAGIPEEYAADAYADEFLHDDPLADLPPAAGQQETLTIPRPAGGDKPAAAKKGARKPKSKRASVPTWDEILFGSKTTEE